MVGGSTSAAVLFAACGIPEDAFFVQAPFEMPEDLVSGLDNWYATLCTQCPTSEGIVVRLMEGRAKKVEGNVNYPLNRGAHSVRCEGALQALYHPDRIKGPLVRTGERGSGQFAEISWDDALGRLTHQLGLLRESGDQSKMVMATNPLGGHLGLVVERFVSRFGGRYMPFEPIERTTLQAAIKQVYDEDVMPDFDIENSNYILSFGSDFLNTWVSPVRYARGYGEFRQGDRARGKFTQVESRFSMTAANADRWVYIKPGMEGALALSIAQVIISENLGDANAANELTGGGAFNLDAYAPDAISEAVGVSAETIRTVAREFAEQRPSIAFGGGSAGAHTNGLFNLAAIYSLNYLVGSVGQQGGIIFNPGPPVGDLPIAATTPFTEWRDLSNDIKRGDVKILMVRGADPWYGLPDSVGIKDELLSFDLPFIFSFSGFMDDTTSISDLILPEHSSLEDWGSNIPDPGPGYEMIGFQQPVVRPFFEPRGTLLGTRNFADTLIMAANELGLDLGLPGEDFKGVLQDGAMKLFEANRGSVTAANFKLFWNQVLAHGGWWDTRARSSKRAPAAPRFPDPEEPQFESTDKERFPFHLIPFESTSLLDGRGAGIPWMQATPDPITTATWQTWIEINHRTAEFMDINEGDVIRVISPRGTIEVLAFPHPGVPPDTVSIPMGQGHRAAGRYAEGRGENVLSILAPLTESKTGALAWAATRVRLEKAGRWTRLPKFENTVPDFPVDEEGTIIQLTPTDR